MTLTKNAIGQPVSARAPSVASGEAPSRSARHAPGRPAARRLSERTSHAIPDSASARPRASGRPKATRAGFAGAKAAKATRTPSPPAPPDDPRARTPTATASGAATRTSARERPASQARPRANRQLRTGEGFQESGAGPERRREHEPASAFAAARAVEGHEGGEGGGHRRRDRVGVQGGLEEVAAQLHSPCSERVAELREERQVGGERHEPREAHRDCAQPESVRGGAQGESTERDSPEGHVETAQGVVRGGPPPQRAAAARTRWLPTSYASGRRRGRGPAAGSPPRAPR